MSNDFDYTPPPDCGHKEYHTETCASCIYKVYSLELQRVIEERDKAKLALEEISELVGRGGDNTPFGRVESMLMTLTGERDDARDEIKRLKARMEAEAKDWSQEAVNEMVEDMISLRKEYVSAAFKRGAEAQREACLQSWIDMCWKVARETASVGPDGWLERYHPQHNEVSQMLRTVPLVTDNDK